MKKITLALLLGSAVLFSGRAFADETTDTILAKLGLIETNQQRILSELETIKSELQIVKVRATNG